MKKKYYKVVYTESDDILHSATDIGKVVRYKQNEWVYAPGSTRLFVFEQLQHAKQYALEYPYRTIWECEVTPGVLRGGGVVGNIVTFWNKVEKNLKAKKKWDHGITRQRIYNHACLVKGVKLLSKIS